MCVQTIPAVGCLDGEDDVVEVEVEVEGGGGNGKKMYLSEKALKEYIEAEREESEKRGIG